MSGEIWDFLKYRQLFPGLEWLYSAIDSKDREALKKRIDEIRAAGNRATDFINENWKPSRDFPHYIPIATASIRSGIQESLFGFQAIAEAFRVDAAGEQPPVFNLPYALDIDKNTNILVEGAGEKTEICQRFLRDIIWGFLVFVPATKLNISVFDCESMGSSIAALFDLKKQNPDLFDRDICTNKEMVYEKLSMLNMQITDCIQNKLGSRYRTLMEYNRKNPAGSEPVRLLMINDFPSGFDSRNVELLQNILKNGGKCGIYVLLHYNRDIPFSRYENMENTVEDFKRYVCAFDEKNFPKPRTDVLCDGKLAFPDRGAEWFALAYAKESEKIRKQGILFDNILDQELFARNASSSLEIPIGIGDGGGTTSISFGRGSSHHALIAGATGSGKSQLIHTMIISAMMHYSPDEVNLYLMDFKNGTEFKIYDSYRLPHIRLLAIDAMQEFGESILEELLNEVNRRSEQFKRTGVSKMADYVGTTGKPMPRILVIMDEFQQLFNSSANRVIAGHCAELAKRIVTEGRSYGIHLLMATQSTKIVSGLSIDMGTIEQMRIRIGLKCNEDDARFLFKDNDIKAVGMMKGPIGTAVINQEYTEGENRKFRAAYCNPDERGKYLEAIARKFAEASCEKRTFEGSRTIDLLDVLRREEGRQPEDPVISVEVGECIKVAPPLSIRFGKQKIHNILICGADEKMAGNLFYLMNWDILRNPYSRFYCIDGNLLVDEMGSMPYYEIFRQYGERFKLAESRGDIIRFIHEVYDLYKEKKKHNTKETIFVGIRNFQFLDIVKQMMKGDMIDESEYLDPDEEASFDTGDPFAAEGGFDFGVGMGTASNSDPTGVSERMIKLITDGTAYGIHFILTSMEYQSIKENMYYGENVLSKFPEKFVFSLNDADADALIPGISVAALTGNTVYYTDSVKDTCQVKPYVFPEIRDLAWFVNAEPAWKAYAAEEYETALRLYEELAEKGFVKAQYNCGWMYDKGKGTPPNKEAALRWYEKAAQQGHKVAQYNCGWMYDKGEGTLPNKETALQWYEKAAKQGDKEAQYKCGWMYFGGEGIAADKETALRWWEEAAKQGDKEAQFCCGCMYYDGEGTSADKETALHWYEKAAEQGDKEAQYSCGLMYANGEGTEANKETALQWHEKAAAQGHIEAQYNCGLMYANGEGTEANEATALQWYEKAASQGHKDAQFQCGWMYYNGKGTAADKETALRWWEEAARQGDKAAQYNCGLLYSKGDGTAVNKEAALKWYEQAAGQGDTNAQYNCGVMYANGEGTSANPETALQWYEKAASQGHKEAQYNCGVMYANGNGTSANPATALQWYEKAASQGHKEAQYNCGVMYANGNGTSANPATALQWYEKAASQGHIDAQFKCGWMYYSGEGTAADKETAFRWWEEAAKQGHKVAQYNTGLMYDKGEGTAANKATAFRWYEKAAEQGYKDAQFRCGWMYSKGNGTSANKAAALQWYEKAASQGHKEAQYNSGLMYDKGEGTAPNKEAALRWYEKAAGQGHKEAQVRCGVMYANGEGAAPNPAAALGWYEKAAAQGSADAQFECGKLYHHGEGITHDMGKSIEWFQKAAQQGHVKAMYNLAVVFYHAEGVPTITAYTWFEKAANSGHVKAQYKCAEMLYNGDVPKNREKARMWLQRVASQNADLELQNKARANLARFGS